MTDLHARFAAWLAEAAPGDPPRDLALHASACPTCLARAAGIDALASVDPGMAPVPPQHVLGPSRATGVTSALRAAAGITALGLLVLAVLVGANAVVGDASPGGEAAFRAAGPDEGVLGAAGGVAFTPTPEATPSATPTSSDDASPSGDASPTPASADPAADPAPDPTRAGSIRTATPRPTSAPPTPTVSPTRQAATPTPSPTHTPSPTPAPTPSPTPAPTPTPPQPECSDGIDNDDDGLIDYGLDPLVNDPDCLSPDDDEAGLLP